MGGDGRWIIAPTRYSPENPRLLGRMARSGDRAPQAVYRKCRGLWGMGRSARYRPCAERGKRRTSLRPRIKFALFPSIEAKDLRKLQKVFFSFGSCTARFLFFCVQKKRKWGGAMNQPSSWLNPPCPSGQVKTTPARRAVPLPPRLRGAVFIAILSQNMQNSPALRRILVQSHN